MQPEHHQADTQEQREPSVSWLDVPQVRYPTSYILLILVSALDIMLTVMILMLGGSELNPIAAAVIAAWGFPGAIAFKFALMTFVIIVCEVTGRQRDRVGRRLVTAAVLVSSFPVVYSFVLLGLA